MQHKQCSGCNRYNIQYNCSNLHTRFGFAQGFRMLSELAEDFKGVVELKNAKGQVMTKNMVQRQPSRIFEPHRTPDSGVLISHMISQISCSHHFFALPHFQDNTTMGGARDHAFPKSLHPSKSKEVAVFEGKRCADLLPSIKKIAKGLTTFWKETWTMDKLYISSIPNKKPHAVQEIMMTYKPGHVADMVVFSEANLTLLLECLGCSEGEFSKKLSYVCLSKHHDAASGMVSLTFVPSAWNKSPRLFCGEIKRVVETVVERLPKFFVDFVGEIRELSVLPTPTVIKLAVIATPPAAKSLLRNASDDKTQQHATPATVVKKQETTGVKRAIQTRLDVTVTKPRKRAKTNMQKKLLFPQDARVVKTEAAPACNFCSQKEAKAEDEETSGSISQMKGEENLVDAPEDDHHLVYNRVEDDLDTPLHICRDGGAYCHRNDGDIPALKFEHEAIDFGMSPVFAVWM